MLQAFIDVAMAGKGPGATPLREPFQGAFAAGFFEQKEPFDKALQVGARGSCYFAPRHVFVREGVPCSAADWWLECQGSFF